MKNKVAPVAFSKGFCRAVGIILLVFAGAKFFSLSGKAAMFYVPEPVFGISYRYFFLIAALAEWALGLALLWYSRVHDDDCVLAILLFCVATWLYRYAFVNAAPNTECPCLGTVTQKLGISPAMANTISLLTLSAISVGSLSIFLFRWRFRVIRLANLNATQVYLVALGTICLCLPYSVSVSAAEEVTPEPVILLEGKVFWKRPTNSLETRFSIILDDCRYKLEETGQPGLINQSLSYDGTNWIHMVNYEEKLYTNTTRITNGQVIQVPLNKPIKPGNPATVTVSPALEPLLPKTTSLMPLWLGFAGGCYFRDQEAPRISPLYHMNDGRLHPAQRMRATRILDRQQRFLSHYTDYWDADLFPKPEPGASGLTNIAFWVTSWTNLESFNIPLGFRFVRYFFSSFGNTSNYFQSMDGTATVEKAEIIGAKRPLTPSMVKNSYVVHHPATNGGGEAIGYYAPDARLKPQAEVNALASPRNVQRPGLFSGNLSLKIAIIIIAASVPLIFLVRITRNREIKR